MIEESIVKGMWPLGVRQRFGKENTKIEWLVIQVYPLLFAIITNYPAKTILLYHYRPVALPLESRLA
jgi:hypothetical protein